MEEGDWMINRQGKNRRTEERSRKGEAGMYVKGRAEHRKQKEQYGEDEDGEQEAERSG